MNQKYCWWQLLSWNTNQCVPETGMGARTESCYNTSCPTPTSYKRQHVIRPTASCFSRAGSKGNHHYKQKAQILRRERKGNESLSCHFTLLNIKTDRPTTTSQKSLCYFLDLLSPNFCLLSRKIYSSWKEIFFKMCIIFLQDLVWNVFNAQNVPYVLSILKRMQFTGAQKMSFYVVFCVTVASTRCWNILFLNLIAKETLSFFLNACFYTSMSLGDD